jgi:hypothetical protein
MACKGCVVQIRRLRLEQRQGEPKFEKVKRRLEESKASQRGPDGPSFRSSADMDRHRQLAADSAIQRQLEAQSAFRSQANYLQSVVNRLHHKDLEIRKLCVINPAVVSFWIATSASCDLHML